MRQNMRHERTASALDKPHDISNKLAGKVIAVLAELEGYTPPETNQDWTCVLAAQVIRSLCLVLGVPAQGIEAAPAAETVELGSVHESPVPQGCAQTALKGAI